MRVIISIIIACVLSVGIFSTAIFIYQYTIQDGKLIQIDETSVLEEKFYSQNFTGKKIFILGSSLVHAANAEYIENYLLENEQNYEVYNLAIASDKPIKRLKTIDNIIKAQPDVVVYGIGFSDVYDQISAAYLKSENPLPDPRQFFAEFMWYLEINSEFNFNVLSSTRTVSFGVIDNILQKGIINPRQDKELVQQDTFQNTPFFKYHKYDTEIMNEKEVEMQIKELPLTVINPPQKNKNVIALKKTIDILQENNIQVMIFTTPYHKLFYEMSPNYDQKAFNVIIEDLTKSTNTKINFLHSKYNNTQIWHAHDHLVVNKNSTFYSEDIARIILSELDK